MPLNHIHRGLLEPIPTPQSTLQAIPAPTRHTPHTTHHVARAMPHSGVQQALHMHAHHPCRSRCDRIIHAALPALAATALRRHFVDVSHCGGGVDAESLELAAVSLAVQMLFTARHLHAATLPAHTARESPNQDNMSQGMARACDRCI